MIVITKTCVCVCVVVSIVVWILKLDMTLHYTGLRAADSSCPAWRSHTGTLSSQGESKNDKKNVTNIIIVIYLFLKKQK